MLAYYVFLIVQFIRGIALDLDQAALVDGANAWQLFTMSIVSLVPVFVFFILAQRQLVAGISTSGLKG